MNAFEIKFKNPVWIKADTKEEAIVKFAQMIEENLDLNLWFKTKVKKRNLEELLDHSYESVIGPNTNQIYAYDNDTDEFIDPPASVIKELDAKRNWRNDPDGYAADFQCILDTKPEWLLDITFRYDAEKTEI